jgi:hypothetical protein
LFLFLTQNPNQEGTQKNSNAGAPKKYRSQYFLSPGEKGHRYCCEEVDDKDSKQRIDFSVHIFFFTLRNSENISTDPNYSQGCEQYLGSPAPFTSVYLPV